MSISIPEYIANENFHGVVALAKQLKYPVPSNPNQATNFLDALYAKNPTETKKIYRDLHPDREILEFEPNYQTMIQEPLKKEEYPSYQNAVGCPVCSMKNAVNENVSSLTGDMQRYANEGLNYTRDLMDKTYDKFQAIIKEKDDQKYRNNTRIAFGFVAGAVVGIIGTVIIVKLVSR